MAKKDRKTKKRNFTDCEVEVLVNEVEQRQRVLFGGHSLGITNAKKKNIWEIGLCCKLRFFICLFTHRVRKLDVVLR